MVKGLAALRPRIRTRLLRACIYLLPLIPNSVAADSSTLEDAVKATYLYKLPAFVSWPAAALPAGQFVLCVVGRGPFGSVLDHAIAGQTAQGRAVVIRRYQTISANPGCQLMYIAGSGEQSVAAVLALVRTDPVLTVTDGQSDDSPAGIINFVLQDGYVRFEVDPGAAAASHLAISSKLLAVAARIRGAVP
jgi:hypothetical protein